MKQKIQTLILNLKASLTGNPEIIQNSSFVNTIKEINEILQQVDYQTMRYHKANAIKKKM